MIAALALAAAVAGSTPAGNPAPDGAKPNDKAEYHAYNHERATQVFAAAYFDHAPFTCNKSSDEGAAQHDKEGLPHWPEWITAGAAAASAIFAGLLFFVTRDQLRTAAGQLALARDEFTATHRPQIRVRNINVRSVGGEDVRPTDGIRNPMNGEVFKGQLFISNVGSSDAVVTDGHLCFWAAHYELPMQRPYEGEDGNLGLADIRVPPGASVPVIFESALRGPVNWTGMLHQDIPIYAMGWIEYRDGINQIRRTAFCRRYHSGRLRFVHEDGLVPDYEGEE